MLAGFVTYAIIDKICENAVIGGLKWKVWVQKKEWGTYDGYYSPNLIYPFSGFVCSILMLFAIILIPPSSTSTRLLTQSANDCLLTQVPYKCSVQLRVGERKFCLSCSFKCFNWPAYGLCARCMLSCFQFKGLSNFWSNLCSRSGTRTSATVSPPLWWTGAPRTWTTGLPKSWSSNKLRHASWKRTRRAIMVVTTIKTTSNQAIPDLPSWRTSTN